MFLTQIYGTALGAIINYVVMISIVNSQFNLLANTNGNSTWSGAVLQSYNTNATSWALAKYLYTIGSTYSIVPLGMVIGAGIVVIQRILAIVSVAAIRDKERNQANIDPRSTSRESAISKLKTSTLPSCSSTLASSPTTSRRPASSSVKSLLAFTSSFTCETTAPASSEITHTLSLLLGTARF